MTLLWLAAFNFKWRFQEISARYGRPAYLDFRVQKARRIYICVKNFMSRRA